MTAMHRSQTRARSSNPAHPPLPSATATADAADACRPMKCSCSMT